MAPGRKWYWISGKSIESFDLIKPQDSKWFVAPRPLLKSIQLSPIISFLWKESLLFRVIDFLHLNCKLISNSISLFLHNTPIAALFLRMIFLTNVFFKIVKFSRLIAGYRYANELEHLLPSFTFICIFPKPSCNLPL